MIGLINWIDKKNASLYKIAYSYLYNHHDIEDAFQNTIIKVYENIYDMRKPKYFESWFISILLNECRQILRKKKVEVDLEVLGEIQGDDFQDDFDFELKRELEKLDEKYRDVIILKYICGYSEVEIANVVDIKVGTVKSRTFRGLDVLRKSLGEGYFYE